MTADLTAEGPDAAGGPGRDVDEGSIVDVKAHETGSPRSRWAAAATLLGCGLVAVVVIEVGLALIEGLVLKGTEPQGLKGDLGHHLGYAFGGVGTGALLFLVVAEILVVVPAAFDVEVRERIDRFARTSLWLAVALSVVIVGGSALTARYTLHAYSESGHSTPSYVSVQVAYFFLGVTAMAALVVGTAIAAFRLRSGTGHLRSMRKKSRSRRDNAHFGAAPEG